MSATQVTSLTGAGLSAPRLQHVVLDAGALISGVSLAGLAQNYWSLDEVVAEIRDVAARERLAALPFELKLRRPSDEAMKQVVDFAKKTGDFRELSRTDLLVLALTYMLEVETNGTANVRTEPVSLPLSMMDEETIVEPSEAAAEVEGAAAGGEEEEDNDEAGWTEVHHGKAPEPPKSRRRRNRKKKSATATATTAEVVEEEAEEAGEKSVAPVDPATLAAAAAPSATPKAAAEEEEDDGEGEWIGPDTLATVGGGSFGASSTLSAKPVAVGCITTDFAMQNVLLQLGLNLLSVSGKAIKSVKQWVLKCDSCYDITSKMDRLFCGKCGNPTLARLGVTLRADGQASFHYKKGRKVNLRGTKFPLPKPKGGRDGDLLLREDQLLTGVWKQRMRKKETLTTMFADCNVADLLPARQTVGADVVVGFGRRNPNAMKGRERRGKPKKSH